MNIKIKEHDPVYPIGVVADMFNVSVHTLRLYEKEGLILPFKTGSGRRMYCQADLNRLGCIRELIEKKGLNISGIKMMLAMVPCWDLLPCTEEDRKNCDAFYSASEPCWTVPHKSEKCQNVEPINVISLLQ